MPLSAAGEAKALSIFLAFEPLLLRLYVSCATAGGVPTVATILGDLVEPAFTGYAAKTLTNTLGAGTWAAPAGTPAASQYNAASPQSWTSTGGAAQTVLGAFYVGANSGVFYHAEAFAAAQVYNSATSPTNTFTPRLVLGGNPNPTS